MYAHPQHGKDSEQVQALRRLAGKWVRAKREAVGLSQRQLAQAVGLEYYTFISQIESGRGRIPPDRYVAYARALKVDVRELARTLMRYYDPVTYEILFEIDPLAAANASAVKLGPPEADDSAGFEDRLSRIEKLFDALKKP